MLLLSFLTLGIFASLLWVAVIDLRTNILPNTLIVAFLIFGCSFHIATHYSHLTFLAMLTGGAFAFALTVTIRLTANLYYKRDAFGLGDVKLLTAAGLFLGIDYFLIALTLGATAGMLHGIVLAYIQAKASGTPVSFNDLAMPAGPGFVAGILLAAAYGYHTAFAPL